MRSLAGLDRRLHVQIWKQGMGLLAFIRKTGALIARLAALLVCGGAVASAAEIKVVSGSAVAPPMADLIQPSSDHQATRCGGISMERSEP